MGNPKVNKIFKPETELELYKENIIMRKKKEVQITGKSDKMAFKLLSPGDYFVFQNGKVVFRKEDEGTCIDEDGKVVKLVSTTLVNHLYEYGKEEPVEVVEEPNEETDFEQEDE